MPTEILFADFETRSPEDLLNRGQHVYAAHPETDILCLSWGLGQHGPIETWSPDWCSPLSMYDRFVEEDRIHLAVFEHVKAGGILAFTNAIFDRRIWNDVLVPKYGAPPLPIEQVICVQAQAEANNLPGKLEKYCEALDTPTKKHPDGKMLIAQLCSGTRETFVLGHETKEKMRRFRKYCEDDVESMRQAFFLMRPLTAEEWIQYHASEAINDRGVLVDVGFAKRAKKYAEIERSEVNDRLKAVTGDPKCTIKANARKAAWLFEALAPAPELQDLVFRGLDGKGRPRYGAAEDIRTLVRLGLTDPEIADRFSAEQLEAVTEFLDAIEAGSGAAVDKFNAAINRASADGRVRGQYVLNGGGQTGRYSSRGIQIHNLVRKGVPKIDPETGEHFLNKKGEVLTAPDFSVEAIDDIVAGESVEAIEQKYGLRIVDLMRRLVRPMFMAEEGKTFVIGDWSQIEARVLPWLSDSDGGRNVLSIFASGRDLYQEIADKMGQSRQIGKVATLSLGYGGSVGAFHGMAKNYGVRVSDAEAKEIVTAWRGANGWAVNFWYRLWDAFNDAWRNPETWWTCGRVAFMFIPHLMKGTMICVLPSGRWIHYPELRGDAVVDEEYGTARVQVTCRGTRNGQVIRKKLWPGLLAENATQASSADFLREILVRLQEVAVLHTHDEVVLEVPEEDAEMWVERLKAEMLTLPVWAQDLPLDCEVHAQAFYSK